MAPKILLSTGISDPTAYIEAVQLAGGEPIAQYCPQYDESFDALILCGGLDVQPSYYDQPMAGTEEVDPKRDTAEMELVRAFLDAEKPIFGICRGCQLLNIYFGGTLIQHLDTTDEHRINELGVYIPHAATAELGSILSDIYGLHFNINSHHHQAIDTLGNGFRVTIRCPDDGVVEAIEHETLPIFAVQWHPEQMTGRFHTPTTADGLPLFRHFVSSIFSK